MLFCSSILLSEVQYVVNEGHQYKKRHELVDVYKVNNVVIRPIILG